MKKSSRAGALPGRYRFYDGGMLTHQQVSGFFFPGFEIFAHAILIVVLLFLNVEKHIQEEQKLIAERKKGTA